MTTRNRQTRGGAPAATPAPATPPPPPPPPPPASPAPVAGLTTTLTNQMRQWASRTAGALFGSTPAQANLRMLGNFVDRIADATTFEQVAEAISEGRMAVAMADEFLPAINAATQDAREDRLEELAATAIAILELLGIDMPTDQDPEVAVLNRRDAAARRRRAR